MRKRGELIGFIVVVDAMSSKKSQYLEFCVSIQVLTTIEMSENKRTCIKTVQMGPYMYMIQNMIFLDTPIPYKLFAYVCAIS